MIARRSHRVLLIAAGILMTLLIGAEALGHWAHNRGIGLMLEALGSRDSEFLGKSAQRDLEVGNFAAAEQKARKAVLHMPIHQKALRIQGMAQLAQKRPEGNETIRTAGLLGWRDVPTQAWLMMDNLQGGDARNAMNRADAVARRSGMRTELFSMMALFAGQPATQPILMERLQLNPDWRSDFFRYARQATADQAQVLDRLLRSLKAGSTPPTREEVAPVVRKLVDLGAFTQAEALASDMLGGSRTGSQNPVWDGSFSAAEAYEDPDYARTPFEWELGSAPGVTVFVSEEEGNGALYAQTNGSRDAVLASQTIRVPAGNHVLRFMVRSDRENALERFQWQITCVPGTVQLLPEVAVALTKDKPQVLEIPFTVPAEGCEGQTLRLRSESVIPRASASIRVDDVAVVARP